MLGETPAADAMLQRTLRVGNRDIHVAETGEGAPLLMLHGGGPGASGAPNFERNIPVLSRHFRVIVPDLPGYGRSTKGLDRKDPFGDLARTMLGLLDVLGVSSRACARQLAGRRLRAAHGAGQAGRGRSARADGAGRHRYDTRRSPTKGLKRLLGYYTGEGPTREKMATFLRQYLVYDGSRIPDSVIEARFRASTDPEVVANPPLVRPRGIPNMPRTRFHPRQAAVAASQSPPWCCGASTISSTARAVATRCSSGCRTATLSVQPYRTLGAVGAAGRIQRRHDRISLETVAGLGPPPWICPGIQQ